MKNTATAQKPVAKTPAKRTAKKAPRFGKLQPRETTLASVGRKAVAKAATATGKRAAKGLSADERRRIKLREFVAEMIHQHGPIPEELRARAKRALDI